MDINVTSDSMDINVTLIAARRRDSDDNGDDDICITVLWCTD